MLMLVSKVPIMVNILWSLTCDRTIVFRGSPTDEFRTAVLVWMTSLLIYHGRRYHDRTVLFPGSALSTG